MVYTRYLKFLRPLALLSYLGVCRGTRGSYQRWADEVNDQSYTFENLLLFYQKSINFQGTNTNARPQNATLQSDPSSFGQGGPIQVCYPNWANTISSFVQQGLQELGFDIRPDFVSGDLIGQQYISFQIELSSQTRSSFEVAYLGPALNSGRKLTLYENTLVKKILFDDQKRANGVLVDSAGTQYSLRAKNEVILSAGAHRSPQLLTVSGVGPSATLNDFGVPVLSDLAGVGQNLQDQPFYGPSYPVGLETHNSLSLSPEFVLEQVLAYRQNRTGFLTNPGSDYLAYEKLPEPYRSNLRPETRDALDQFPSDWPEVLYTVVDAYSGDGRFPIAATPLDGRRFATILLSLVAPLSRGNVTINSTDTADNPVITSGLISDPRDQDVAVQAFKRIRKIVNTTAVQSVVTGPEEFPGLNVTSDDDILQAIRYGVSPIWHASSTNKMGVAGDQMAVVDSEAKVFGVQALRVVDVSAFPFLPPQHPSSLVCRSLVVIAIGSSLRALANTYL